MASEANKDNFRKAIAAPVDKYVKQQGRNTIELNCRMDPVCEGYVRIPGPDACDFCVTMGASDNFYHTEESAGGGIGHGSQDDLYHAYCNCTVAMVYRRRGELVAKDPDTDEVIPYDGASLVQRYREAGSPTFRKNRAAEAERRRARRKNGETTIRSSRKKNPYNGAMLSDADFEAGMKALSEAESMVELKATAERIVASWPRNANGRNKAQWDKMSGLAKIRRTQLLEASERERIYGVPYKDAMVVPDGLLESNAFTDKFVGISDSSEIDEKILEAAKHALERNSGKKTESLTLIDVITSDAVTVDCDIDYGIEYNDEIREFIKARKDGESVIIAVHNHPNGMPPSLDDFSKAAENNYSFGVVVGHNGQVYTYKNFGKVYSKQECDAYNDLIVLYIKDGGEVDRICTEVFASEGLSYGLR